MKFADKMAGSEAPPTQESPAAVFRNIKPLINSDIVKSVGASYLFVLSGEGQGNWILDLKNGEGSVGVASDDTEADVTFKMDSEHMVQMFQGQLNPTTAFMTGKMKISGDFGKATKLEKLMGQVKKSKL